MSPGPLSPVTLNKAPTPWLTQRQQQAPPAVPPWAQRAAPAQRAQSPPRSPPQQLQQQPQQPRSPPQQMQPQQQPPGTRIIPIQVEGREPPRAAASPQPGGRPQPFQSPPPPVTAAAAPAPPPGMRIIPIQMEGAAPAPQLQAQPQSPQNVQQRRPVYVHNKFNPPTSPAPESASAQSPRQLQQQQSWGSGAQSPAPIQSRSFRVLQKITDTDQSEDEQASQQNQWSPQSTQGVPVQELRKLQLSEDDRALMNKFKAQVDEDTFLHNESDPRYRGPSIPSRAFRMLQSMTDGAGGDFADQHQVPRGSGQIRGPPSMSSHQSATDATPQPYIPPSEQQAPEPRKYVGGSIPSRSFRMLQAMTGSPENCANVTSPDGRETPVSVSKQGYDENGAGLWGPYDPNMSPYPPYWCPEAWWGYYPPPDSENQAQAQQRQQQNQTPVSQEYWDPYAAMYAYNAAYGYPPMPYPMYPPPFAPPFRYPHSGSDSDEYSGYSSTDEMAYYGAKFARGAHLMNGMRPPMTPRSCATPASNQTSTPASDSTPTPTALSSSKSPNTEQNDKSEIPETTNISNIFASGSKTSQDSESSVTPAESSSSVSAPEEESSAQSSSEEESSGSDTEVEEENGDLKSIEKKGSGSGLQMIRSVSDINVYKNNSKADIVDSEAKGEDTEREESNDEEEEEEEEEDEEEEDDCGSGGGGDDDEAVSEKREEHLPHQLSVIFEESEQSDVESVKHIKHVKPAGNSSESVNPSEDGDSSTATLDDGDDDDDDESDVDFDSVDPASSTVTVRLPLKLKFSRSANNEEVTTVIVGNSQVKRTEAELEASKLQIPAKGKEDTEKGTATSDTPSVSVTLSFPSRTSPAKSPTETPRIPDNGVCRQMSTESLDVYETCESDSDVSVCLSLPLRKKTHVKNSPRSTPCTISNISEEDDDDGKTKADESDTLSHWDDDSSSTSIQTVKLSSSSGRSTASDFGNKSENEDATVHKKSMKGKQNLANKAIKKEVPTAKKELCKDTHPTTNDAPHKEESSSESESEEESTSSSEMHDEKVASTNNTVSEKITSSKQKTNNKDALSTEQIKGEDDEESSEESDESEEENETDAETAMIVNKIYDICTKSDSKLNQIEEKLEKEDETEENKKKCENTSSNNKKVCGENEDDARGNNSKFQEESEEDDSGVTSDMSRQISDADTDGDSNLNELQLQCQRVATHSRLFKLLQDECSKSDDEDEGDDNAKEEDQETDGKDTKFLGKFKSRKEHLSLPLQHNNSSDPDSLSSSSGVTSPASPTVTARLVKELVQTLLQRKKGRRLKKLPIAKLHAAALRLLQEDMDPYDTVSSAGSEEGNKPYHKPPPMKARGKPQHSNTSTTANPATPANHSTASTPLPTLPSPAHMTYGANYYDYCDYYNTWANAAYYGADPAFEYNIVPSRAFKLLQEHAQPTGFSSGVINGLWAKCPRIPSSKNIHKDIVHTGIVKENQNKTANPTDTDISSKTSVSSESSPQPLASTRAT